MAASYHRNCLSYKSKKTLPFQIPSSTVKYSALKCGVASASSHKMGIQMWELGEAVQMGFFLLPDLHPFSAAMVSRYSVMGARRNLIVGLLPLSVLSSGDCSVSLFCVCTVLHRHVEQFLHLDGRRGNEPTNLCQILGDIAREDLLGFFPPCPDFLFSCLCLSFPVCHQGNRHRMCTLEATIEQASPIGLGE